VEEAGQVAEESRIAAAASWLAHIAKIDASIEEHRLKRLTKEAASEASSGQVQHAEQSTGDGSAPASPTPPTPSEREAAIAARLRTRDLWVNTSARCSHLNRNLCAQGCHRSTHC
jgi:hypothetical protein